MALAASRQNSRLRFLHHAGQQMREAGRIERLADHAGRSEKDLVGRAADGRRTCLAGHRGGLAALLAGEGVGVAGIDDQEPRLAAGEVLPAEIDRRGRAFGAREDARHLGPFVEDHGQHVGAALVFDPGLGGRHAHAFDGRHLRVFLRSERRNRCGHGASDGMTRKVASFARSRKAAQAVLLIDQAEAGVETRQPRRSGTLSHNVNGRPRNLGVPSIEARIGLE